MPFPIAMASIVLLWRFASVNCSFPFLTALIAFVIPDTPPAKPPSAPSAANIGARGRKPPDLGRDEVKPNSVFIFDDIACEKQNHALKPISKPLKELVQSTNKNNNNNTIIKHEKYPDDSFKHDLENNKVAFSTPYKKSKLDYNTFSPNFNNKKIEKSSNTFQSFDDENDHDDDDDDDDNNDNVDNEDDNNDDDDNTIAIHPNQSIQYNLSKVNLNMYDKTYGPHKDKNQIWRLGNEPIAFNSTNITV
ncbi:hypothetical protein EVAR_101293_1, partial [Eumeta japonica]